MQIKAAAAALLEPSPPPHLFTARARDQVTSDRCSAINNARIFYPKSSLIRASVLKGEKRMDHQAHRTDPLRTHTSELHWRIWLNEIWDIVLICPIRILFQYSQLCSQLAASSQVQNTNKIRSLRSSWALGSNILLLPVFPYDIAPPKLKLVFLMEDGIDFPSPESGAA